MKINVFGLLMLAMVMGLSACGKKVQTKPWKPRSENLSAYGNHSPYRVNGRLYRVNNNPEGFSQKGKASWYGKKFHGKKTSNQETYDMYKLTAAHKTLPLPSYVEVTNLDNGKQVIVRVNDRGPFVGDRIIDLSYAAAKALDFVNQGIANVKIKVIKAPSNLQASPIKQGLSYIQLGAFSDNNTAYNLAKKVTELLGIETFVTILKTQSGLLHRVRIGPLSSENKIQQLINQISQKGISNAQVVTE